MKIVIAGAGKVGFTIAQRLCQDDHDITLVDERLDPLEMASNSMDVMGICGSCASPSVLREAEVEKADVYIAATGNDEANLVSCQLARNMGAMHSVVRLRNQGYMEDIESLRESMKLSMTVNPDYATAEEISRALQFPFATQIETFPDCGLEIVTFRIPDGSRLGGKSLKNLPQISKHKVLVCAVEQGGTVSIPDGNAILRPGDSISVTAPPKALRGFLKDAGVYQRAVKNVLILGGSLISVYLAQLLESSNVKVTIIESDRERGNQLAELLRAADVDCGDGTDPTVLTRNGLKEADAFVALTNYDEDNIILSIFAKKHGVEKVVSKINNDKFTELLRDIFPDTTLSPKNLVAERIAGYVCGLDHASDSSTIEALYKLSKDVVATEFVVGAKAACIGKTLMELKLRPGVLLAAVVRGGRSFLPDGKTVLAPGDKAVIVTAGRSIFSLDDILA
jgi:K+ transport systems, NAD-binding component